VTDRPQTLASSPIKPDSSRVMLGIGLKLISVVVFVAMSSFIKSTDGIPAGQLVFFRSFFAIFPIMIFLAYQGELVSGFKTDRPFGHMWRGLIGVVSMSLTFYGLTKLPLPESIAIGYASPLLIVMLSALVLKETVRLYRWSAVMIGLVGVMIILWPRLTVFTDPSAFADEEALGALATLGSAFMAAGAMLMVRTLVKTEKSATIVIYFSLTSSVLALASIPFGWAWPSPTDWAFLIGAGVAGGIGQVLLTECYRHADMSIIAPFEYSSLILGVGVGYLFFGDVPTPAMLVGGAIVVGAGIFIIYREHRLGLERTRARKVSTPQG